MDYRPNASGAKPSYPKQGGFLAPDPAPSKPVDDKDPKRFDPTITRLPAGDDKKPAGNYDKLEAGKGDGGNLGKASEK